MTDGTQTSTEGLRGMGRTIWQSAVALGWLGFWFWVFSFASSDSFFQYNLCSRLPVFAAALFGAAAVPVSAYLAWKRHPSILGAFAVHVAGLVAALSPLALVSYTLSRVSGPCHLEADDAMGTGIGFLILIGMSMVSLLALLLACTVRAVGRATAQPLPFIFSAWPGHQSMKINDQK